MPLEKTQLGSPVSPRWDADWVDTVSQTERKLGRRVCGARTHAGTPCKLKPNHDNGRCKFHGGFNLTGAQPGNRNAVTHGLYARALRPCGPQCPLWDQCPCAGDDVARLPAPERPTCPYETAEYETAVTDITEYADLRIQSEPMRRRMVHQTALLHVMMSRAFIALRDAPLAIDAGAKGAHYENLSQKPNPLLHAYFRIAREFRNGLQWLKDNRTCEFNDGSLIEFQRRAANDASLNPEDRARLDTTVNPARRRAEQLMETALGLSRGSNQYERDEALVNRRRAKRLVPDAPEIWDIQLPHEIEKEAHKKPKIKGKKAAPD